MLQRELQPRQAASFPHVLATEILTVADNTHSQESVLYQCHQRGWFSECPVLVECPLAVVLGNGWEELQVRMQKTHAVPA